MHIRVREKLWSECPFSDGVDSESRPEQNRSYEKCEVANLCDHVPARAASPPPPARRSASGWGIGVAPGEVQCGPGSVFGGE